MRYSVPLILVLTLFFNAAQAQKLYSVESGLVSINSNAPNEIIKASSTKLQGAVNTSGKKFVFKVAVQSMEGFNSPLQREHFNENYLESHMYPDIVFSGKIIEDIDITKDGDYKIRAKGKLKIHGEEVDRIIYVNLNVKNEVAKINSEFYVALADHNIKIPRVVDDKLATQVLVQVKATMILKTE